MSRRARNRFVAVAVAAAIELGSGELDAAPLRASLEVQRGAGAQTCLDGPALTARVEELAGAAILSGDEPRTVALVVEIEAAKRGFHALIRISGERSGERVLESPGPGCEALGQGLAVSIAIVLDAGPGALLPEPPPALPPPLPPPPSTPAPVAPARPRGGRQYYLLPAIDRPAAVTTSTRQRHRSRLAVSVGSFYDAETLDDGSGGVLIGLDVYFRWVSVAASFVAIPRDELRLPSHTLVYELMAARARACFEPFAGSFGIAACSGLLAGQRRAGLAGVEEPAASSDAAYVAATFEAEVSGAFYDTLGAFVGFGVAAPIVKGDIPIDFPRGGIVESPNADVTFQMSTGLRVWLDP